MRLIGALLCLAVCATALPAAAFDFSDARHVVALSSPQLSPDGTRIVYVRGVPDFSADRTDRQLWLLEVRTRAQRQLTWDRKGVSDPSWSHGGDAIAFTATDNDAKKPEDQIFVLPMDGGDARQITHAKNGVDSYAWSPDGRLFAYTMQDDDPNKANAEKQLDAFQVQDNDYLHRSATPPVHVWICDADGKHARRLTSGSWSVAVVGPDGGGSLSWSPDSKTIAIVHYPTPFIGDSLAARIELLDVRTGALRPLDSGGIITVPAEVCNTCGPGRVYAQHERRLHAGVRTSMLPTPPGAMSPIFARNSIATSSGRRGMDAAMQCGWRRRTRRASHCGIGRCTGILRGSTLALHNRPVLATVQRAARSCLPHRRPATRPRFIMPRRRPANRSH